MTTATSLAKSDDCNTKLSICDSYVHALQNENQVLYKKVGALEETVKQEQRSNKSSAVKWFIIGALVAFPLGLAIAK